MKMSKTMCRLLGIIEVLFATLVPTSVIYFELNSSSGNSLSILSILTLTLWLALIYLLIKQHNITRQEIGLASSPTSGARNHALFTVLGIIAALALAFLLERSIADDFSTNPHFKIGFIVTAVVQQLVFRGYMITVLEKSYFTDKQSILISSLLFALVHMPFEEPLVNLSLTLVAGLGWGWLFIRHRNIYLLILSHAILNFIFVLFGFISNAGLKF